MAEITKEKPVREESRKQQESKEASPYAAKKEQIIEARDRGPGPGRYKLPSTCGYQEHDCTKRTNPSYSFAKRLGDAMFKKECSPGPCHFINARYTRHGQDGTPAYSLLARQKDPNVFKNPGPGAYQPEKVHPQGEAIAPIYSMRARTRYRKKSSRPAPNRYGLPQMLGSRVPNKHSTPSYSFTGRSNIGGFHDDMSKTPGPGRYNAINPNVFGNKLPQYSMLGRSFMPGDSTIKPGPGAHRPENVRINKRLPPKHSMGVRHSEFVCSMIVDVAD